MPYKKWCSFCVMGKAKADYEHPTVGADAALRTYPTVQVDMFFNTASLSLLLTVDVRSNFVHVVPVKNKNAGVLGELMAHFLGSTFGYMERVELAYE